MSEQGQVYVEVVKWDDGGEEVVKRMGPMSEWKAEKVEMGLLINMNVEAYFVRTVPAEQVGTSERGVP
jgi:hypothetical protein